MFVLTEKKIKKYYKKFNELYFENKLPHCFFKIKHTYKYIGCFEYKPSKQKYGKPTGRYILFSDIIEWDEEIFSNVLMHEMIHCYLAFYNPTQINNNICHGDEFKKIMNFMNKIHGFNVVIESDIKNLKPSQNVSKFRWWLYKKIGG